MSLKTVKSKDGRSVISYRQVGTGPGIIALHGGLGTSKTQMELAEALSDSFTIYLVDRRGRGRSSPINGSTDENDGLETEVNDLQILLKETNARLAFGVSSGALVILQSALIYPDRFEKVALFEPPVVRCDERFQRLRERFRTEVKSDVASAALTAMEITELGPWLVRVTPRWFSRPLVNWGVSQSDTEGMIQDGKNDEEPEAERATLRKLIPTLEHDFNLIKQMEGTLERCSTLTTPKVLVVSGTATRPYLKECSDKLEKAIPDAKHIRVKGADHLVCANKSGGGQPETIAEVLREYFREQ